MKMKFELDVTVNVFGESIFSVETSLKEAIKRKFPNAEINIFNPVEIGA